MKIVGISGSSRKDEKSGVMTLVKTVLENTDCDYELISLKGKSIAGCIACMGCVKDNVCKVDDDFKHLRGKIVEADAFVIGAPNYYSTINALTHAFMERWFQFRHQTGRTMWGKLAVAVGVGGTEGKTPAEQLEKFLMYNLVETVASVSGQGAASCFTCGYGETCQVGIPQMLHGPGVKITDNIIPNVEKQETVMAAAAQAGKLLGDRLKNGHDRAAVTQAVQEKMMATFGQTV